ncbi:MAG: hypothetical protein JNK58_09870 [Phycisphaerae bacterium]|nr:hypothetical protein [Phycisphaerae bacterium]
MELTAYVVSDASGWSIEPAPLERQWMNETPARFAYRCLPLVMANQAGWIVRCPVGFRVRWNGSDAPHGSMDFAFDESAERWSGWISSHFGSGVLTFSLPWLFRTPRPMLLRVSGAPNWWKIGAAALEGLVETFWSPYTFTMNWKLTQPGACVSFAKGEPICFLQPVDVGLAESLEPRFRAIAENAELKGELEAWTRARRELIDDPNRGGAWQKNYFQGKCMSGAQEPEHRSRLAVRAFEGP